MAAGVFERFVLMVSLSSRTHPPMPGPVTLSGASYTLPTYTGDMGDCMCPSPPIRLPPSLSHEWI